jgi:hypothetical protein
MASRDQNVKWVSGRLFHCLFFSGRRQASFSAVQPVKEALILEIAG